MLLKISLNNNLINHSTISLVVLTFLKNFRPQILGDEVFQLLGHTGWKSCGQEVFNHSFPRIRHTRQISVSNSKQHYYRKN